MKGIATVNFKGGVGKTTVTWLLAKHATDRDGKKALVIDSDAQMSLTLALGIDEVRGRYVAGFGDWYEKQHRQRNKTLLDAIDQYARWAEGQSSHFDFPISENFIYRVNPDLHFIPSVEDLYWLELEVFKPQNLKGFIGALLGKIEHSKYTYDIAFFDCPPSFTVLSYSILSNCSLILIPVNPDVFAATGLKIMIDGLRDRIQPWPKPRLAVFMNKARLYGDRLTRETHQFLQEVREVAEDFTMCGIEVKLLDTYIPERAAIRKAINFGGFPEDFRVHIDSLWQEISAYLAI